MNENEIKLFKSLCKYKDATMDNSLIEYASPEVLGHIFYNRMQGVAYDTLRKNDLLGKVNREFRNTIQAAYEQNVQRNQSFSKCVAMLSDILSQCSCQVAMLKGAYLCLHYPDGYRTSNDVDLLVLPQDVTEIGNLLTDAGFKQGHIRNGKFSPATRPEIIASKMMRGETVPYIKEVNLPFMNYFEVDINFSLDYKNGCSDILTDMLSKVYTQKQQEISIPTLNHVDFFIHLCAHLYKEATTLPWIKMHRDMTLYKYCDIYTLLSEMSVINIQQIFERAYELGLQKICAYAILETMELFDMECDFARLKALEAIADEPDFCLRIISPTDKKTYTYKTANTTTRFFMADRTIDLKEIDNDE